MASEKPAKARIRMKNKHYIGSAGQNDSLRGMWLQCRLQDAAVGRTWLQRKRKAEEKAAFLSSRRGDPNQALRILGRACRLHRDAAQRRQVESDAALIPWPADPAVTLDRFDVRVHLDAYREPEPSPAVPGNPAEGSEEAALNFERYRWLVDAEQRQCGEAEVLAKVRRAVHAALEAEAALQKELEAGPGPGDAAASSAPGGTAGSDDSDESDEVDEEDFDDAEAQAAFQALQTLRREADTLAVDSYGIPAYSVARDADEEQQRQEAEMRLAAPTAFRGKNPLPRHERLRLKRLHQREKELQRLAAAAGTTAEEGRAGAAQSAEPGRRPAEKRQRRRSRSRSPSPYRRRRRSRDRSPEGVQFITSFSASSRCISSSDESSHAWSPSRSPPPGGRPRPPGGPPAQKPPAPGRPKLTPAERLKQRTQAMLDATLRKDLERQREKEEERQKVIDQYTRHAAQRLQTAEPQTERRRRSPSRDRDRGHRRSGSRSRSRSRDPANHFR